MELYDKEGNKLNEEQILDELDGILLNCMYTSIVEVIDSTGRAYTNYDTGKVSIAVQDNTKTLKIFID